MSSIGLTLMDAQRAGAGFSKTFVLFFGSYDKKTNI